MKLWYPGNEEALAYNQQLRALATSSPSARSGFVSEGDVQRSQKRTLAATRASAAVQPVRTGAQRRFSQLFNSTIPVPWPTLQMKKIFRWKPRSCRRRHTSSGRWVYQVTSVVPALPDAFQRGTSYTQPRTVTLDTKYEGVPAISVWTGYAVMVVSKTGARRVEHGPTTILLNYDEVLEVLELSTGKPKNTDQLEKTVYLRVVNNKVSDWVSVKTKDLVDVTLKLSYRVNFEGYAEKWFACENYVKFLCDHVRSVLKGMAQKRKVEDFGSNGVDIVREAILGAATPMAERTGMVLH